MKEVWDELAVLYHEYLYAVGDGPISSSESISHWISYQSARDSALSPEQQKVFYSEVTRGMQERWRAAKGMSQ